MQPFRQWLAGDLRDHRLMYLKAFLFLLLGLLSAAALLLENPSVTRAVLLALTVWAFCRLYYFAFYVIEKYVDPSFRFAGLASFAQYLLRPVVDTAADETQKASLTVRRARGTTVRASGAPARCGAAIDNRSGDPAKPGFAAARKQD